MVRSNKIETTRRRLMVGNRSPRKIPNHLQQRLSDIGYYNKRKEYIHPKWETCKGSWFARHIINNMNKSEGRLVKVCWVKGSLMKLRSKKRCPSDA